MITTDVLVLGGGWAGITTAYYLLRKGINVMCVDADIVPGGLLKSEMHDGFVFDVGRSHVIFSSNESTLKEMLGFLEDNVITHQRRSFVQLIGKFIPYPLENNLHVLPPELRAEILVSLFESLLELCKEHKLRPRNLREYIVYSFGKEIARLYLEPYNEKIWKRPLDDIDVDWLSIPGRLPLTNWKDIVKSCVGIPTIGYEEQATFYYPLSGGIQALYDNVLKKAVTLGLKLVSGVKVETIKRGQDRWILNNMFEAKSIISTIPLREVTKVTNAPEDVIKLAEQLDYNSVAVVGVALKRKAPDMHWVYVSDKNIVFHRYAWISNYSPHNVPNPDKYSSILVEITLPPNDVILLKPDKLMEEILYGLKSLGIISEYEKEVLFTKIWMHRYGYPLHTFQTNKARRDILRFLSEHGIISVGRWGLWKYLNIDRILEDAKDVSHNVIKIFKSKTP